MNLQRHGLALLATGILSPVLGVGVVIGAIPLPGWLPTALMVVWILWFFHWAASGGIPPRFA